MTTQIVWGCKLLSGFDMSGAPQLADNAGLVVVDGMVTESGPLAELVRRHPGAAVHGGERFAVTPGFVNAHHHVGLTPVQLGSLDYPLEQWFASRLALRDVDLYADTLFSAFEMIASGVTTVQHLHSRVAGTADDVLAAADKVIAAYRDIGMRASYSFALRDQNRLVYEDDGDFLKRVPEALRPALSEHFRRFTLPLSEQVAIFDELLKRCGSDALLRIQLGPANLHWLSDDALDVTAGLAQRTGLPVHMHLLETPYQKAYAQKRTGGSAVAFLERLGLLNGNFTIGHGVWMDDDDIRLCADRGVHVCCNCSSNMRLASGRAPVNRFMAHGLPVAIGIDEAGLNDDRDMLQEMRLMLHSSREPGIGTPRLSAADVFKMATANGAATTPFRGSIGSLAPGMAADLVLFDWREVTYPYQDDLVGFADVLVHRAKARAVHSVMIAGEWVYRARRFTRVDQDAVLDGIAHALQRPRTLSESARAELGKALMPYVTGFYDDYLDRCDGASSGHAVDTA